MNVDKVQMVLFSPTGTTRRIVDAIAQGIHATSIDCFDLTLPGADTPHLPTNSATLAIIGCPVYAGRVPALAISRYKKIRGNGIPAVLVVVYGNREYEDALLELRDLARDAGFVPVAAGAFIGEHSYSTPSTPIAMGRPDADDIRKAESFGAAIREKVRGFSSAGQLGELQVPGNFPYKELLLSQGISPSAEEQSCIRCGKCASVCPIAAIPPEHTTSTNANLCIRCCACVKACPTGARKMDHPRIMQVAEQLSTNCKLRKEPETYL